MKHFIVSLVLMTALFGAPKAAYGKGLTAYANPATPGQVIAAINAYRAANGLYGYTQSSTLMAVAQGQSDYQASIGTVTHEGPGGSRPRDRAIAAGYGGGATVFVSEIIYGGGDGTVETAITWWKNSSLHNDQMLASTYIEIGAGVASNGSRNYYTAVMGYIAGGAPPVSSGNNSSSGNDNGSNAAPTAAAAPAVVIIPAIAATPQADGSIVHIIRTGQALWNVAAVYDVPLATVLELNNLPEWAVVHPGDEILVRPASSEAASASPTPTPDDEIDETSAAAAPAASQTPTPDIARTASTGEGRPLAPVVGDAVVIAPTGEALAAGQPFSQGDSQTDSNLLQNPAARWVVILAFGAILAVVVLGGLPGRPPARPDDNDPVR